MQQAAKLSYNQRTQLWKFVRADTDVAAFETWLYEDDALEAALGNDRYLELISCNFSNSEETHLVKKAIRAVLECDEKCHCAPVRNLDAIEMGGDWFFEKFFSTLTIFAKPPPEKWWLYASKCSVCGTSWLVAQEERIHDMFYVERMSDVAVSEIKRNQWPTRFQTYADVLDVGVKLEVRKAQFIDPMSGALQVTVEELLQADPEISANNIGSKLGISRDHAESLMTKVKKEGADATTGFTTPKKE